MATTQILAKQHAAHKTYNCAQPKKGSEVVSLTLDLQNNTTSIVDFTVSEFASVIEFIQSLYIDNSLNGAPLSVQNDVTNQIITVPANSQAYKSVLVSERAKFTFTSTGGAMVPIQFLNFPVAGETWDTGVGTSADISVNVVGNNATDGSGTITTGATAQNLFAGTAPANGFAVYNPDPTNDLWVSDSTTAAANAVGSIRCAANGGGYETPPNSKPLGVVSIFGGVTGQKFTARRW